MGLWDRLRSLYRQLGFHAKASACEAKWAAMARVLGAPSGRGDVEAVNA